MATVFAGENLLDIDHISVTPGALTDHYTVPAGRWAKIRIYSVVFSGAASGNNVSVGDWNFDDDAYQGGGTFGQQNRFNAGGWAIDLNTTNTNFAIPGILEIIIKEGQTVTSSNTAMVFSVQEYANP